MSIDMFVQVKGALERALMASRFRKEFVDVYVTTYVKNAELRVAKVPGASVSRRFLRARIWRLFANPHSPTAFSHTRNNLAMLPFARPPKGLQRPSHVRRTKQTLSSACELASSNVAYVA